MCTLSIAPAGRDAFVLVSNRDESMERSPATLPQCLHIRDRRVLMPIDPEGGGSWVALSDEGRAACLLNGAREAHESEPPYAMSRGLVLKASFEWSDPEEFLRSYPLCDIGAERLSIEPFTLVLLGIHPEPWIEVLRWDGRERELEYLDPERPHVLSAPKLYSFKVIRETEERFQELCQRSNSFPSLKELERFNEGERYRLKMEKAGEESVEALQTLSRTSLSLEPDGGAMTFLDHRDGLKSIVSYSS